MSFLDKFKGSTNFLSKPEAKQRANTNSHHKNAQPNASAATQNSPQGKAKASKLAQQQAKQNKVSPFYVVNPFYLDELEREREERAKKEQQIRQRVERERKKQLQLQAKLVESSKINKDKFISKQWIAMGGLGPNLGTEQWTQKTHLHNKMMTFAKEIQKLNFQKIKCLPFVSLSHLHQNEKQNPRTKGIQYSHSVPRPRVVAGLRTLDELGHSQSKEELSQMQRLDVNHIKYVEMMKKL